jgi:hypothetical protein
MKSRFLFIGVVLSAFLAVLAVNTSSASIRIDSAQKVSKKETQNVSVVSISAFDASTTQRDRSKSDGDTLVPLPYDATTQGSVTYLVQLDFLTVGELGLVNTQPISILLLASPRIPSVTDYFRYSITPKAP